MILRNKNILLISPEPWNHIFVSKHHYAVHLGRRGNHVYFLEPPGESESVAPTEYENVVEVKYRGFPKGLRFYPHILQRHFIRKKFRELERLCNTRFDIIWSFDNSVFFDFSALPDSVLSISHIVDLNQDFQFVEASRTAQLCLGVSRSIVKKQVRHNKRSYFINHGFSLPVSMPNVRLPPMRGSVCVGYAGNLDLKYIDWDMLHQIILAHPEVQFFFAGPLDASTSNAKYLQDKKNVVLLGRMTQEEVAQFYLQMDALLLCYLADRYPEQLENSHKMMEYLGSGKVIVATLTQEYSDLNDQNLIVMSKNSSQYAVKVEMVLSDLEYWNSQTKQESRKKWALENTYEKQLQRIESLLNLQ